MIDFRAQNERESTIEKLKKLFSQKEFQKIYKKDDLTAIKLHFGEKGNDGFISPVYVRQGVDFIKKCGAKPFLTDTNTLYKGSRANAIDHTITAIEHGFDYAVVNAPIIIADGLNSQDYEEVPITQKHFDHVKIASAIIAANSMLVLSHFKCHEMAGFGGAIKNLAMGCAPVVGKMAQHSARPLVRTSKCQACGACVETCDWDAYTIEENLAKFDSVKCVGCGKCLNICPHRAIVLNWDTDISEFIERMTEYAYGAIKNKQNKCLYINFINRVTPGCDCYGFSDASIVPDIGILASTDPVAIDQAAMDLVNQAVRLSNSVLPETIKPGEDKFRAIYPYIDSTIQLQYGEKIGLGTRQYSLIRV